MPRFLQQRLAELLGLVSGKSQAHASSNMTVLVLLVILYRASFWFARGAGKKTANQKECRVAERDDGIPVIIVAAVKNRSVKGHQTEASKRCVLIPILFHIAQMG